MTDIKQNLLLFFERPKEPCFMHKGKDNVAFQVPDHYFPEKYKNICNILNNRFGKLADQIVSVKPITIPDLSLPMELSCQEHFSLFIPRHREMAGKLIDIFMGMDDLEDLQSICAYCQMCINPYMFNYCLSVCLMNRPDTKGLNIPTIAETFPTKFVNPKGLRLVQGVASATSGGTKTNTLMPVTIPVNLTASDREPEQRVAYFREDIGINLHHWHWHLVYPFDSANINIVNKDRRGELFYYMHQQILARYNAERMCNGLLRVVPYNNLREPIAEAYFPKLTSTVASRAWPPRFANTRLSGVARPLQKIKLDLLEAETWREHFVKAIDDMSIRLSNDREKALDEATGIDVLGNMMEASIISPNKTYYGDFHNLGHLFICFSHDPENHHLEPAGVMGDPATAMRDPVFYRWHAHIDNLFQLYKNKLTPYEPNKLDFPGVRVSSINIDGPAGSNIMSTLWEQSLVDLNRGLDFSQQGSMPARFTHLQHEEFDYVIEVNNTSGKELTGAFRIFIAPSVDDDGQKFTSFDMQRKLMIELDKFSHTLKPGNNKVRRHSVDSSVTIPHERTFRNQTGRTGKPGSLEAAEFDFCGCGWPHHMLIPKGTAKGYPMVLFVMVSNWNEDKVEQDLTGTCNDAASYCGIRDRKYPDKQAMGYPFDRSYPNANNIQDFLRPNMAVQNCKILFTDRTRLRGEK